MGIKKFRTILIVAILFIIIGTIYLTKNIRHEYFIVFQNWSSISEYSYDWNTYTITGYIDDGNKLKSISESIKEEEEAHAIIILNYKLLN